MWSTPRRRNEPSSALRTYLGPAVQRPAVGIGLTIERVAELRGDGQPVAPAPDRLPEQDLAELWTVYVGGVEQGDAQIDRFGHDLMGLLFVLGTGTGPKTHEAQADRRDFGAIGAEPAPGSTECHEFRSLSVERVARDRFGLAAVDTLGDVAFEGDAVEHPVVVEVPGVGNRQACGRPVVPERDAPGAQRNRTVYSVRVASSHSSLRIASLCAGVSPRIFRAPRVKPGLTNSARSPVTGCTRTAGW